MMAHFNKINKLRCFAGISRLAGTGADSLHLAVFAKVAELVDALDLGSSAYGVGVRVPPFAPVFPGCMTAKQPELVVFPATSGDNVFRVSLVYQGVAQ
jgi:hypothetical protein